MIVFIIGFLSALVTFELCLILALVNRLLAQAHIPGITPDVQGMLRSNQDPLQLLERVKKFSLPVSV